MGEFIAHESSMMYPDDMTLREAVGDFVRVNGYGVDGGISDRWVKVVLKPLPLAVYFPNCDARRDTLPLHDIHHVVTGYGTSLAGEAEIAAWEIGGSCRRYWVAWMLNFMALCYGWYLLPVRSFRAFVRGRHTWNLYDQWYRERMLDETVGAVRERLHLNEHAIRATGRDWLAYAASVAPAALITIGAYAALVVIAIGLWRLVM